MTKRTDILTFFRKQITPDAVRAAVAWADTDGVRHWDIALPFGAGLTINDATMTELRATLLRATEGGVA